MVPPPLWLAIGQRTTSPTTSPLGLPAWQSTAYPLASSERRPVRRGAAGTAGRVHLPAPIPRFGAIAELALAYHRGPPWRIARFRIGSTGPSSVGKGRPAVGIGGRLRLEHDERGQRLRCSGGVW